MKISSFFGKPVMEVAEKFKEKNLTISDTNNNGLFDKSDELIYTVQKGDSLFKIAHLFDGYNVSIIKKNNPKSKKADIIQPGEQISIPLDIDTDIDKDKKIKSSTKTTNSKQKTVNQTKSTTSTRKSEVIIDKTLSFKDMKIKKITDAKIFNLFKKKSIQELKDKGYYVFDRNNNGFFDKGDDLYRHITIMLDAGHGSGIHLEKNQKIIIPNTKEKYTTKEGDTLESIAKLYNIDLETLKKANQKVKFSRDPGALPPEEYGNHDEAYFNGVARDELAKILSRKGFRVIMAQRVDRANLGYRKSEKIANMPDMYVSIHCNAADIKKDPSKKKANGEEIVINSSSSEDRRIAEEINNELKKDLTFNNRKNPLKIDNNILVLKGDTKGQIAECLVEWMFITNEHDYKQAEDPVILKKQMEAISRGIINYSKKEIE